MTRRESELERLKQHLMSLSEALPALMERVQAEAAARAQPVAVGDAELERQRLAAFAAYLEHFSRIDGQILGPIDLRALLEQAMALARAEIAPKAKIIESYLDAPLVRANSRQLGHVFVSLLINAAQALSEGNPEANHVAVELDTTERGWARIAIADSGGGIADDVRPHIFEPMFSTKRGTGMGIGLAAVREIVEGLGGTITVESEPGQGSLFIVELPPAS